MVWFTLPPPCLKTELELPDWTLHSWHFARSHDVFSNPTQERQQHNLQNLMPPAFSRSWTYSKRTSRGAPREQANLPQYIYQYILTYPSTYIFPSLDSVIWKTKPDRLKNLQTLPSALTLTSEDPKHHHCHSFYSQFSDVSWINCLNRQCQEITTATTPQKWRLITN